MRSTEVSHQSKYVDSLYAEEDACLHAIRERLIAADRWGVNISANEGRMLQLLIQMVGAKKIVEIGTLFGYSGVWMARALPVDGHLFTIERDHDAIRMAKKGFEECGVASRVTILEGEALEKLATLSDRGPFDMVFIDANKSAYVDYLEWATRFVRPGGLIVADNTLLGGGAAEAEKPDALSVRQWSEMRRFNSLIADRTRYQATILPTTEGLTVAIRL